MATSTDEQKAAFVRTTEQKVEHLSALRREAAMAAERGDSDTVSAVHEQIVATGGKVNGDDEERLNAAHDTAEKRLAPQGEQR